MRKTFIIPLLAAGAFFLSATQHAAACEWEINKEGQKLISAKCVMVANAEWADAVSKIIDTPLERVWPPADWKAPVQLPNLRIDAVRTGTFNGRRDMVVAIINDGPARVSTPFVVRGGLAITDAYRTGMYQNGVIQSFAPSLQTVNSLDVGDTVQLTLFEDVRMPNGEEDFDLFFSVFADWDPAYSGGSVSETDETDNLAGKHCRVFQATSNAAPPPIPSGGSC